MLGRQGRHSCLFQGALPVDVLYRQAAEHGTPGACADGAVHQRQLHRHVPEPGADAVPDRLGALLRQPADGPQLLRQLRHVLPV